jgi:hypothetical protein
MFILIFKGDPGDVSIVDPDWLQVRGDTGERGSPGRRVYFLTLIYFKLLIFIFL